MPKDTYHGPLEQVDDCCYRIPKSYKQGMRVDGLIFCDENLLPAIQKDQAPEQVANVAFLPGIQLASLLARSGMERGAAEEMIKSQMPLEEKITKADHVVWNNGDRSVLKGQAEKLVELWRQEKWTKA